MRAPVSIVIPTLEAERELPGTLACLIEGLELGLLRELIVSDGGSLDGTAKIAEGTGATVVVGCPGRGGQLARGASAAGGEWLLFLHADTQLSPGWASKVQEHIQGDKAAYFRLRFDANGFAPRLVAGWANLRSRLLGLPYGDQGLLVSREMYDRIGGFDEIDLMEDVAVVRKLKGHLTMLDAAAITNAARYERHGWLKQGTANLWRLVRYLAGTDPGKLARSYRETRQDT